jgi:hypothetical protein
MAANRRDDRSWRRSTSAARVRPASTGIVQYGRIVGWMEPAKLVPWTGMTLFLTELIGMGLALVLTWGVAAPVVGTLVKATRIAVRRIFERRTADLPVRHVGTHRTATGRSTAGQTRERPVDKAVHQAVPQAVQHRGEGQTTAMSTNRERCS